MKKTLLTTILAALIGSVGSGVATAQDDGFYIIPVEMFVCTYNARQGPDDLDRWVTRWNAWADSQGIDNYAAWTLTPYYYGPGANEGIDVIWLGAAKTAAALGAAQESWLATNNGLNDDILEILTCGAHANYASANFKMPPQGVTADDSVLTFSDCKMHDGASFSAVTAAMDEWADYQTAAGSQAGIWHFYPAYGGGGDDFDFKWVSGYENLEQLGEDYDRYGNGRGFMTRGRLMGHLVDCDSARAYRTQNRRYVQLRD